MDDVTERASVRLADVAPRVILIEISSNDPFVGAVVRRRRDGKIGFEGWLGFLRAISQTLDDNTNEDDG